MNLVLHRSSSPSRASQQPHYETIQQLLPLESLSGQVFTCQRGLQTLTLLAAQTNAVLLMMLLKCQGHSISEALSTRLGCSGHWLCFDWLDAFALTNARCETVASAFLSVWICLTAAHKSGYISARLVQQSLLSSTTALASAVFSPMKPRYCVPFISLPLPPSFRESRLPSAPGHQTKLNKHAFNSHLSPVIKGLVKFHVSALLQVHCWAGFGIWWRSVGPLWTSQPINFSVHPRRAPEHSFGGGGTSLPPTWTAASSRITERSAGFKVTHDAQNK